MESWQKKEKGFCFQRLYLVGWHRQEQQKQKKCPGSYVLITGSLVGDDIKRMCPEKYNIFIWDVRNLLWIFEEFSDIKNEFISLLNYTIGDILPEKPVLDFEKRPEKLKYIFGDYLTLWEKQESSNGDLYRFDLCCKIKHGDLPEFFDTVKTFFHTKYIVFEFKNYEETITQKEIYTTEKYLYQKALRSVAIIISRKGADKNALSAVKGCLRENGKLILCLSDRDLLELVKIKDEGERSTAEFLEDMLDAMLIHLEK